MLALRSSHRGVRLHTFEPEDRVYTSTPTKIGGHALDHVVGVTLTWSRSLSRRDTNSSGARSRRSGALAAAGEGEGGGAAAVCSTTLEPSMSRFGGLSVVVHRQSPGQPHLPNEPPPPPTPQPAAPPSTMLMSPPLVCPTLAVLPPDTLATPRRGSTVGADVSPWPQEYGPEWTRNKSSCDKVGGEQEVEATVAPLDGSGTNPASIITARRSGAASGRAVPYRDLATAATGHSGALMAILLSKLANGGYSSTDATTAVASASTSSSSNGAQPEEVSAAAASRTELLHRSVDTVARGLDNISGVDLAIPVANSGGDGSWAWKARVDQTPPYSKLRRYEFVRELGSGSHGTILLVRKRPAAGDHPNTINDAVLDASKRGGTSGGGTRSRSSIGGSDNHGIGGVKGRARDPGGSRRRTTPAGALRVLKESPFLPEAVNEARLLLLAGGSVGGVGSTVTDDPGSRGRNGGAGIGVGAGNVGVIDGATASRSGGDGSKGYQRGEVVQLQDFFVETLGHRALAFLELEYCEGGDLRDLILGGRAGRTEAAATAEAARVRGDGDAPTVPQRESVGRTGSGEGDGWASGQGWGRTGNSVAGAEVAAAGDMVGLPAVQIGKVALGLCEGLQSLHERGVLHRDLKPANVLLTKSGAVRVADLGVSTCLDPSHPLTENAAGTIPFMAPEVRKFLLGSKVSYSGKADVWALGALVYAMAVGDPAPEALATQPRARLVADVGHQTGSEALARVAHRALDPDPSRRPSVHQMTSMLRDCCEREGWLASSSRGSRPAAAAPMARL
eukprot:g11631.t2